MLLQPWKIQLFGGLALRRDGLLITRFPTEKVGLLLAYLAASPSPIHTREELIDLFWPDSASDAGRVSLRQALSSLRRLLEPPGVPSGTVLFSSRSLAYLNSDAIQTDLEDWNHLRIAAIQANSPEVRIQRLIEAIGSYSGDFLPGAYMDWVLSERQYRQGQYVETLLDLSDAQAQAGDMAGAIDSVQLLLRTDPLHEEAQARLIRLLAVLGKSGLARQQYRKFARLLHDELQVEPGHDVQALYANLDQIVSQPISVAPRPVDSIRELPRVSVPGVKPGQLERAIRLPLRTTRFFGREVELKQISAWLQESDVRIVTLTGMGGVGKTRLALQAAEEKTRFGKLVTFVPLSDTRDPDQLLPAILQSMGMPAVAVTDPLARLAVVLGAQPHLLVLDNFEQIAEGAAETLWRLLDASPTMTCLVTSTLALNLPGEHEMCLDPLPLPATHLLPQELAGNTTVQLLVDRMRARRPDFQVTRSNASAVASLCVRLEGIPLAVELAAGWARDLTVGQMCERLDRPFDLLVSRQHGVPPRHQSLRTAVESSFQLLQPNLQALFLKLSVIGGGWLEAMASIACDEIDNGSSSIADSLRALREHSFITAREFGDHIRYGMLETLRAFGREMLSAEESRRMEAQYAAWLSQFAVEISNKLHGRDQATWLDRMEEEQDNLRGALDYSAHHDPELGLRLCNAMYWFWYARSSYSEGEKWISMLLERAKEAPKSERAWALLAAGHLANCQSNNLLAVSRYEAARALFEEIGESRGVAHTVSRLGNAAQELRDVESCLTLCAEGVARFRMLDDPSGLLLALFYYLNALLEVDKPEEGEACFAEAHALAESLGDLRFLSLLHFCFSNFRRRSGDITGALDGFRRAIALQMLLREPLSVSYILRDLSSMMAAQGNRPLASTLYGAMRGLRRRIGYPIGQHENESTRLLEAQLFADNRDIEYSTAFNAGEELDFDACLALAAEAIEGSKVKEQAGDNA